MIAGIRERVGQHRGWPDTGRLYGEGGACWGKTRLRASVSPLWPICAHKESPPNEGLTPVVRGTAFFEALFIHALLLETFLGALFIHALLLESLFGALFFHALSLGFLRGAKYHAVRLILADVIASPVVERTQLVPKVH